MQGLLTKFFPDGEKVTISTHVDDLQPTGNQKKLDAERKALEEEFGNLTVQKREYTHVGMEVVQNDKVEITIGQCKFTEALSLIEMAPKRRTQKADKVSAEELAELRAKVGSLSWLALNTRPDLACITSELQTEVATATVETLIKCSGAIERAKMHKDEKLIYRHLGKGFHIECFCDSAFKSKTEPGRPRYGVAIRLASDDKPQLGGHRNLILWKSSVTKGAVRSTLGAETIAGQRLRQGLPRQGPAGRNADAETREHEDRRPRVVPCHRGGHPHGLRLDLGHERRAQGSAGGKPTARPDNPPSGTRQQHDPEELLDPDGRHGGGRPNEGPGRSRTSATIGSRGLDIVGDVSPSTHPVGGGPRDCSGGRERGGGHPGAPTRRASIQSLPRTDPLLGVPHCGGHRAPRHAELGGHRRRSPLEAGTDVAAVDRGGNLRADRPVVDLYPPLREGRAALRPVRLLRVRLSECSIQADS